MKLALNSFVGSAMALVGLIAAYVLSGDQTFDLPVLMSLALPAGLVPAFGCSPGWWLGKLSRVPNSSIFQL